MARALRVEFPGALYHVTSRGNRRKRIFDDDRDREHFLELLGEVSRRYVVLNPVRANMVKDPGEYRWSSYLATAGLDERPE